MPDLVLRDARLPGADGVVDVAVADGVIARVGPGLRRGREEIALDGRWLMPGLWDAHVHFTQWARTRRRLDVSSAASATEACALVRRAGADAGDMVVGFGFRWATWSEPPTLAALDAARLGPTVLLSGDLHTAWVSTAAAARLGLPRAGVLVEDEAFAAQRVLDAAPVSAAALEEALNVAAGRGIVGIVDLELDDNASRWAERAAAGLAPLRVEAGFYADLLDARLAAGAATGTAVVGTGGLVTHGPLKVITDGSLNTLTAHCLEPYPGGGRGIQNVAPDALGSMMARAAGAGIGCAIHAIGDAANRIALDAFAASGARGSIEHAQLLAVDDVPRFAGLGIVASVQPEHLLDDREVADELWAGRTARAFPLRDLADAGARIALGSDAPVAPLDPWLAIAAACHRTRDERAPWHPEQALTRAEALAAATRHAVAPGAPADLVAVDLDPLTAPPQQLRTMPVALTAVAGRVVHRAP